MSKHEREQLNIERKLNALKQRQSERTSLIELAVKVEKVLENWQSMSSEEKQAIARIFIDRIIVVQDGKHRVGDADIRWRDGSSTEFRIPYRSNSWKRWSDEEEQTLRELIDTDADQITISQSLPNRNWNAIRIKAKEILGDEHKSRFHFTPKSIRDKETFEDYQLRLANKGKQANVTSGNRWTEDELITLEALIDRWATQLEFSAALPIRSWEAIRKKIVASRENSAMVTETGHLALRERFSDYLVRYPSAAGALQFSALSYSSQRRHSRTP